MYSSNNVVLHVFRGEFRTDPSDKYTDQIITVNNYYDLDYVLNKSSILESFILCGRETEKELFLFNDQNRIIIRDNNSKEQLEKIIRTACFAEE